MHVVYARMHTAACTDRATAREGRTPHRPRQDRSISAGRQNKAPRTLSGLCR